MRCPRVGRPLGSKAKIRPAFFRGKLAHLRTCQNDVIGYDERNRLLESWVQRTRMPHLVPPGLGAEPAFQSTKSCKSIDLACSHPSRECNGAGNRGEDKHQWLFNGIWRSSRPWR